MLPQSELEVIQQYLDREGRVFAMLDSLQETGLEDLLLKWNIHVGYNVLIDPQSSSFSQKDIYIRTYGDHPITRNLNGVSTIFYSPCSVKPIVEDTEDGARPVDRPWVEELVSCSASGWAESDPSISPAVLDENKDEKGPISLAVAAERGPGEEVEVSVRPTRLVVVGDSDFASNGLLRGGSIDFFLSSINWLLDRDELLAISSKPIYASPLRMSQDELNQLFLLTVVAIPASGALLGFIVWMRRRA
jgi:ABC-type uncharacterized transport system involved in gliding motility auxiliary subunit